MTASTRPVNNNFTQPFSRFSIINNDRRASNTPQNTIEIGQRTNDSLNEANEVNSEASTSHDRQSMKRIFEFRIVGAPESLDDDVVPYFITNNYQNKITGQIITKSSYTSQYQPWNQKTLILYWRLSETARINTLYSILPSKEDQDFLKTGSSYAYLFKYVMYNLNEPR